MEKKVIIWAGYQKKSWISENGSGGKLNIMPSSKWREQNVQTQDVRKYRARFWEIEVTSRNRGYVKKVVGERHRKVTWGQIIEGFKWLRNVDFSWLHLRATEAFEQGSDIFMAATETV